ncbi:MAG TPA: acyltransferase [Candidatus Sulfotelmatobacter sp.]|jgi:peptidoglycan/LPS O-acetylase OafA/YrhL
MNSREGLPTRRSLAEVPIIPELDGVRGIAILLVLAFHFGHVLPAPGNHFFTLGWAGVDLFFALSGYLITRILWTTRESPAYFVNFYGRRILRIFPLAFAFLAAYFWIALPISHHFGYDLDRNGSDQWWYWAYLANWHIGRHGSLSHLWSLSIEEQFYLIWPAVIYAVSRAKLRRLCVLLVILPFILRLLLIDGFHLSSGVAGMTFCRTEALALGALIALSDRVPILSKLALPSAIGVILIAIRFGTDGQVMAIYGLSLIALACAGFISDVVGQAGKATVLSRALRAPWLRQFGKYSYAIYVLHAPILAVVFHLYAKSPTAVRGCSLFVIGIAASYAAGWISWHLFESRILRLKRYFSYDQPRVETAHALVA